MQVKYLLMMVGGVLLSSFSQILLKRGAAVHADAAGLKAQYLNGYVIGGYALLFVAMLIPLYALRFVELKYSAVIESLGYVFVMILSALFLGEKVTRKKLIGNMVIIAGIVLFSVKIF